MAFLQQNDSATISIPVGQSLRVGAYRNAAASILIPQGRSGGPSATLKNAAATYGPWPVIVNVTIAAAYGEIEYIAAVTPILTDNPFDPSTITATGPITVTQNGAVGTVLTNPNIQCTNAVNNFTQVANQNKTAGASASADMICYPDNNTNDTTGFVDIGVASSTFADAAYSVTAANEAYLFGSAPAGAGKSGDLVIATDSTGTTNAIRFYTNGFNKVIGAFAAKIFSSGLFAFAFGWALTGSSKVIVNNGATTTYTVPAGASYVNITTSAASLATTLPAAAAAIDGLRVDINPSAAVATATWISAGATFVGAPTALVANTTVSFIYHHATTQWFQA